MPAIPDLDQLIVIVATIVALQFIAAIIGPGALKFVSGLAILAAVGLAGFALYQHITIPYPGESSDSLEYAMQFGVIAVLLLVSHLIIRGMFRAMARASAA
jgi:hypothetical protein